jgi:NAD(P)-dependent dehydrogenase (short-subunit alcohol dehydrogenase family)
LEGGFNFCREICVRHRQIDLSSHTHYITRHNLTYRETVKALLKVGAKKIVIGGRNRKLQDEFLNTLKQEERTGSNTNGYSTDTQIDGSHLIDLADLQSVLEFGTYIANTYPVIDVLICNAGVMNIPASLTKQGVEQQMGLVVVNLEYPSWKCN